MRALRARLRALNKPLLAILVTHPHPDHFNGVFGLVQDNEVPVHAAASVGRVIEEIAEAKREQWSPTYGAEWPAKTYYPNSLLADRAQVRFGELTFTVRELGPAESHANSYFLLAVDGCAPVAFTGDLAFNGMHLQLKTRRAVVTGSSAGIGKAQVDRAGLYHSSATPPRQAVRSSGGEQRDRSARDSRSWLP